MAKFPIQYAKELPTGRAAVARADLDVRTGAEEMARAVSGLGGALFEIGQKIENTNKVLDNAKAERQYETSQIAAFEALKTPGFDINDDDAVEVIRTKAEEDMQSFQSKYESVNNANIGRYNRNYAEWDIKFKGEVLQLQAAKAADEQTALEMHYYATGDIDKFSKLQYSLEATGQQGPRERDIKIVDFQKNALLIQSENLINTGTVESVELAQKNLDMLDPKNLSIEQNQIRAKLLQKIRSQNIVQEEVDEEWTGEFSERLRFLLEPDKGEPPTFEEIDQSPMSVEAKDKMRTKLRVFDNYSEGELKEAFTDRGEVIADIYDRIDRGEITTAGQIKDVIGHNLHPDTAMSIIEDIRKPYKKDTEQMFRRIFGWSPELGFADDMAPFLYEKALREWKAEVKKQDAVGDKIIEIGRTIVRPYFVEHIEKTMPVEEDIPRIIELALGEPGEIEEEELLPEIEEEPLGEPEVGETRADEKGQLWEYMGGNKWRKK